MGIMYSPVAISDESATQRRRIAFSVDTVIVSERMPTVSSALPAEYFGMAPSDSRCWAVRPAIDRTGEATLRSCIGIPTTEPLRRAGPRQGGLALASLFRAARCAREP